MFVERTTRPYTEKYYKTKPFGYSKCAKGKDAQGIPDLACDTLPSNFNYICGRANEIEKSEKMIYFSKTYNLKDYFGDFEKGDIPEPGAIMVLQKGSSTLGVVVERIVNPEAITISYSIEGLSPFICETVSIGEDRNWTFGSANLMGYTLLRFMYLPSSGKVYHTFEEEPKPTKKKGKKHTEEE